VEQSPLGHPNTLGEERSSPAGLNKFEPLDGSEEESEKLTFGVRVCSLLQQLLNNSELALRSACKVQHCVTAI
jgi:hypothetical protein